MARPDAPKYSRNYSYDAISRLVGERIGNDTQVDYAYDAAGNRVARQKNVKNTTYSYAPNANRLEQIGRETLSFNNLGNLVEDKNGKRSFDYDITNRMVGFRKNGQLRAEYQYNPFGQRVSKTIKRAKRADDDHTSLYFSYLPDGRLLGEVGYLSRNEKTFSRDYIWIGGRPVAQIERKVNKNGKVQKFTTSFIHTDHLNTPRIATNNKGKVKWRWQADAFGKSLTPNKRGINNDPDGDGNKTSIRLRFPDQYADAESNLYYNHHWDYDPNLGRYIQSDPIGLLGGMNTYTYVGNNPVNYIDPLGLSSSGCDVNGCWVQEQQNTCPSGWTCVSGEDAKKLFGGNDVYVNPYTPPEFDKTNISITIDVKIKSCEAADQAAFDKMKAAMQQHILSGTNREAGGWNFSFPDGSRGSTNVAYGGVCIPDEPCRGPDLLTPLRTQIPSGATIENMWHTHGLDDGTSVFSYSDYMLSETSHTNNPIPSNNQAGFQDGYFMNENYQLFFYQNGTINNYNIDETSSLQQAAFTTKIKGKTIQVLGCK